MRAKLFLIAAFIASWYAGSRQNLQKGNTTGSAAGGINNLCFVISCDFFNGSVPGYVGQTGFRQPDSAARYFKLKTISM